MPWDLEVHNGKPNPFQQREQHANEMLIQGPQVRGSFNMSHRNIKPMKPWKHVSNFQFKIWSCFFSRIKVYVGEFLKKHGENTWDFYTNQMDPKIAYAPILQWQ